MLSSMPWNNNYYLQLNYHTYQSFDFTSSFFCHLSVLYPFAFQVLFIFLLYVQARLYSAFSYQQPHRLSHLQQETKIQQMGGKSSNPARKVKHFYFGDVIKKRSFNKDVLAVVHPILNKQEFDEWKELYDAVHSMNKQHILVPLDYEYRKISNSWTTCDGCCGAEAEYEMTYQNVQFSLYSEILNRKQLQRFYTQAQLLKLLYSFVQAGKEFQKNSMHFGDIRTKNILITSSGEVKMVNVASFPSQRNSIEKVIDQFDRTTIFYFAPEQCQYVNSSGNSNNQYPNSKTEAWSIGLCILQAATLQCSEQLYQMPSRQINEVTLGQRLQLVKKNFPLLHGFVILILKLQISQRMSVGQCWAAMRPYSEKITELEQFKRNPVEENNSIRKYQTEGSSKY